MPHSLFDQRASLLLTSLKPSVLSSTNHKKRKSFGTADNKGKGRETHETKMAEGVLLDLLTKALDSLGKSAFRKAASWWCARDELKNLENSMNMIQARVCDAERCQEDASSGTIKEWLLRLKLVLYRADDLIDEVLTVDRQRQQTERTTLGKVGILFSKSAPIYCNRKLANEIKSIRKELDVIKLDMANLNLIVHCAEELPMARLLEKRETASFVNTEDVIGRENDLKRMIEMLFDPKYEGGKITVIPIVGFGGLGKTTLAQLVFNNDKVKKQFDLTKWAHAPEIDNENVMMGKIFNSFTGKEYHNLPLEEITQGIRRTVETNKYLLVLDDIWEERGDKLLDLLSILNCGKQGSKVIVTTRSHAVAKVVGSLGTIEAVHRLGILTDHQSWKLFKKLAFKPGLEENNPEFITIGKEITKMCGNVPLAIKVVGGFLRSRDTTKEWLQVRDAQCLKAQLTKGDSIMAVLKLSYDYLPPALKQCFAYCSLFPKGRWFKKDNLVHLWMAQGYLKQSDKGIGNQYFSELLARNFFQNPEFSNEGDLKRCNMHDLLHDLAQEVAGDESVLLGDEPLIKRSDGLVHVSLNGSACPLSLLYARRMRSLLCIGYHANPQGLISRLQSLRVLSVEHVEYMKLPNSIGRLIHLRYLNLGTNKNEYLPDSITRLDNLQTLNLVACQYLLELPRDFARLVGFRHLLVHDNMSVLPLEFGKMTSLQVLNRFTVGKRNGIDSLPALNLEGELNITFRKWRRDTILEVNRATLKHNQQLTSLTLNLKFEEDEATSFGEMNEMLQCLQVPPNLKYLSVLYYKGDVMPLRWLEGLSKLVSIHISHCEKCKVLPQFSQLHHLKSLEVYNLEELEYVEDEDTFRFGTVAHENVYFPSLEVLNLQCCSKLKGWTRASKGVGERCHLVLPRLLRMEVQHSPMLPSMPLAPKLESLKVWEIDGQLFESNITSNCDVNASLCSSAPPSSATLFMSLKVLVVHSVNDRLDSLSISSSLCNLNEFRIYHCNQLKSLKIEAPDSLRHLDILGCSRLTNISEGLQHLSVLETMKIQYCEELEMEEEGKRSWDWQGLSSLRELDLRGLPKLKELPRGIVCVTTLKELTISFLKNLIELPVEIGYLSLHQLRIENCRNLKSFPTSMQGLTSLQFLYIRRCPALAKRYQKPNGEDCHLIQHIPYVEIIE